jgi:hypothetical protein
MKLNNSNFFENTVITNSKFENKMDDKSAKN